MTKKAVAFLPKPTKKPTASPMGASRNPVLAGGKGSAPFIPPRPSQPQYSGGRTMQGPGRVVQQPIEQRVLTNTPYTPPARNFLSSVPVTYPFPPERGYAPGSGGGLYYPTQPGISAPGKIELGSGSLEQLGLRHEFGHAWDFNTQPFKGREDFRTFGANPVTYAPQQQGRYAFMRNFSPEGSWQGPPEEQYAGFASVPEQIPQGLAPIYEQYQFGPGQAGQAFNQSAAFYNPPTNPPPNSRLTFVSWDISPNGDPIGKWYTTPGSETKQDRPDKANIGVPEYRMYPSVLEHAGKTIDQVNPPPGYHWQFSEQQNTEEGGVYGMYTAVPDRQVASSQPPSAGISQRAQLLQQWLYSGKITLQQYYELASQP